MQTLSIVPRLFGFSQILPTSSKRTPRNKPHSSSLATIPTYSQPEAVQDDRAHSKTPNNISLGESEFAKMASMALNLESGSSLLEDSNEGVRKFRSQSSETGFSLDFLYQKTDDQVRSEYIDRLRYLKVIKNDHPKPHQTLTIFDWDDTILPTSYLYYIGLEKISPEIEVKLQVLDRSVAKLLSKATRIGKTCIVTNGMDNWVETSSKKYLPLTYQTIQQKNILVVSARAEYEDVYPDSPKRWKAEAFLDIGDTLDSQIATNIICLGDSELEIEAAGTLSKKFKQAIVKTVKLKSCPTAEELIKQINIIVEKFDQIYTTLRTLTIKLERKSL